MKKIRFAIFLFFFTVVPPVKFWILIFFWFLCRFSLKNAVLLMKFAQNHRNQYTILFFLGRQDLERGQGTRAEKLKTLFYAPTAQKSKKIPVLTQIPKKYSFCSVMIPKKKFWG